MHLNIFDCQLLSGVSNLNFLNQIILHLFLQPDYLNFAAFNVSGYETLVFDFQLEQLVFKTGNLLLHFGDFKRLLLGVFKHNFFDELYLHSFHRNFHNLFHHLNDHSIYRHFSFYLYDFVDVNNPLNFDFFYNFDGPVNLLDDFDNLISDNFNRSINKHFFNDLDWPIHYLFDLNDPIYIDRLLNYFLIQNLWLLLKNLFFTLILGLLFLLLLLIETIYFLLFVRDDLIYILDYFNWNFHDPVNVLDFNGLNWHLHYFLNHYGLLV